MEGRTEKGVITSNRGWNGDLFTHPHIHQLALSLTGVSPGALREKKILKEYLAAVMSSLRVGTSAEWRGSI